MTKGELMAAIAGLPADTEILIQVPVARQSGDGVLFNRYLDLDRIDSEEEPHTLFLITEEL